MNLICVFFKSHIFEVVSLKVKLYAFLECSTALTWKNILLYTISAVAVLFEGANKVLLELI